VLPGGLQIKSTTMRGVESGGMLCSAKELRLSDESQGGLYVLPQDAPAGQDIRKYLDLDDVILVLKMTPNRADCLSVLGVAREVAALTGAQLCTPELSKVAASTNDTLPVVIESADLCGRFSGRVIRGVNAKAATPDWMKQRLERAGQRSISALVDISNYVMLELGRPSHVFDLDKVSGGLTVRWAREGEQLKLLNEQTVTLATDIGVIADGNGVQAIAGIMGGDATAVSLDTSNVFVECAFWWPNAIVGRARRFNFSTDASHRFERGVDFATTAEHLERITALILEICGGQAGAVSDQTTGLPVREAIRLRLARAEKIIGMPLITAQVSDAFTKLGFAFDLQKCGNDSVYSVTPPSYRFDIQIEEDLIEEVVRLIGYDRLPLRPPVACAVMQAVSDQKRTVHSLRHAMAHLGYQEVVNFGFVERQWEEDFAGNTEPVKLLNPIAIQLEVMRSTMFGSLIANLRHNLSHRIERARLFEVARVFKRDESVKAGDLTVAGFDQKRKLAGLAYGSVDELQWSANQNTVGYFDVKGDLATLLPSGAQFLRTNHPALHPGRSAQIELNGKVIGVLGELHPKWRQKYELAQAPVLFEVEVEPLLEASLPQYADISKQPVVMRDIAFVVNSYVDAAALSKAIIEGTKSHAEWVKSVTLFDLFSPKEEGKGLALNEKSLAFRLVLQDAEKSLTESDVDSLLSEVLNYVQHNCKARLR